MEQGGGWGSRGWRGVEEKDRLGSVTEHTVTSRQFGEEGGEWRGEVMEEVLG